MSEPIISIRNVVKKYPGVVAVDNVSFDIEANEFFALLGPSGCGKTTLLRMIAGFETPTSGQILIDGQDVSDVPANRRPVNMVFQSYAVFPHMTVTENVAYGLKVAGEPSGEIATRVGEALEQVALSEQAERKPDQLSGGQRQRVALARALVKRPKVLLLDEPLSALDAKLREHMQLELAHLQENVGITFIIVTHDQDEALSMADRIAVMQSGMVDQIAAPDVLYEDPSNRFVADFIGKVNLIDGEVSGVRGKNVSINTAALGKVSLPHAGVAEGGVTLAVRPEKVRISKTAPKGRSVMKTRGRIADWAYYGDTSHMFVETEKGLRIGVIIQNETRTTVDAVDVGDNVYVHWSPEDTLLLND
ncbi:MAG: ABC transporter ATP-binding protein [Hyphomicrobiales bacterium]